MKKQNKIMDKYGGIIIIVIVLLLLSPFFAKQRKVQQRYGFSIATPELGNRFRNPCEQIVVMRIDSGGAFFNAGIKTFDVILDSSHSVPVFIRKLNEKPQGSVFSINTIPNGFGAKNCDELWEMKRVKRKVVAP